MMKLIIYHILDVYDPLLFSGSPKRISVSDVSTFLAMFDDFLIIVVVLVPGLTGHVRQWRRMKMSRPSVSKKLWADSEPIILSYMLITLSDAQRQACQL